MRPGDLKVVSAMGSRFGEFQKLAALAKRSPEDRAAAEKGMAAILETMSTTERLKLRRAIIQSNKEAGR